MAEYPTRQFSASDAYSSYMQSLEDEEEKKKAYNIVHHMYKLTNPYYSGSTEESANLSKISKLGAGTSSGLATRLRLMTAADKENLGVEFTGAFQQALEGDLFTTLGKFNSWANKQGPWYDEDLRRKHATTVKDLLAAKQSSKVSEAVDTLFSEYNDEWITGSYTEQNQVRENIANSDAIKNLPSKWRATAMDEVIKMFNSFLSPTGQYAAETEARRVAGEARSVAGEEYAVGERMQKTLDLSSDDLASKIAMKAYDYMQDDNMEREAALERAIDEDRALARGETVAPYARKGYVAARAKLLKLVEKPAKLQTETYWDDDLQDYVLATDQEARDQGLDPEKVGARKQSRLMDRRNAEERFWLEAGHALMEDGDLSRDIFEFYRQHARMVDSPREYDMEIMRLWRKKKKELEAEARASSKPTFEMSLLYGSPVSGQTDDGLSNPRLKKID